MVTGISFVKNTSLITESKFCEIYTLGKQYQVYSNEYSIDTITEPKVYMHVDLFSR